MKRYVLLVVTLLAATSVFAQDPPNRKPVVDWVAQQTGTLIQTNSTEFTDQVCAALVAGVPSLGVPPDVKWGRKVRQNGDWSSRNSDALTYQWSPASTSNKALVDIVYSSDSPAAGPSWQVYGGNNEGNGYWMACPADTPPDPPDPPDEELTARVAALEKTVAEQQTLITAQADALTFLTQRVDKLEAGGNIVCENTVISTAREWGHTHKVTVPVCQVR